MTDPAVLFGPNYICWVTTWMASRNGLAFGSDGYIRGGYGHRDCFHTAALAACDPQVGYGAGEDQLDFQEDEVRALKPRTRNIMMSIRRLLDIDQRQFNPSTALRSRL